MELLSVHRKVDGKLLFMSIVYEGVTCTSPFGRPPRELLHTTEA